MNSEITVTEKAISEINRIKADNNIPSEYGLRIGVKAGGCSGLSYSLGFDSAPAENDVICEFEGLKVFVDPKSSFYLLGTELDYTSGLSGKGFVFSNPRAVKTCGCGNSFSA